MAILVLGCDHGGLELKNAIKAHLLAHHPEIQVQDAGVNTPDSVDYPDIAKQVCEAILQGQSDLGILICGTGIGISMKANRYKGIRAALVHSLFTATMAKQHNNANILCLGGRTTTPQEGAAWVDIWLSTAFEGGRHQGRIDKLDA